MFDFVSMLLKSVFIDDLARFLFDEAPIRFGIGTPHLIFDKAVLSEMFAEESNTEIVEPDVIIESILFIVS